jgi:hypothetical protein
MPVTTLYVRSFGLNPRRSPAFSLGAVVRTPQRRNRSAGNSITQRMRFLSGVEQDSTDEAPPEEFAQILEPTNVGGACTLGGFHLDRGDSTVAGLEQEINLTAF